MKIKPKPQIKKIMKTRKFTLIELLVVISIIAIMAGMLLPMLSRVRDKGKQIQCSSILKQFSIVNIYYSDDYTYMLPCLIQESGGIWKWWSQKEVLGIYLSKNLLGSLFCPDFRYADSFKIGYARIRYTRDGMYTGSSTVSDFLYNTYKKMEKCKKPSETNQIVDANVDTAYFTSNRPYYDCYAGDSLAKFSSMVNRHNQHPNILFLDGHAESSSIKDFAMFKSQTGIFNPSGYWGYSP